MAINIKMIQKTTGPPRQLSGADKAAAIDSAENFGSATRRIWELGLRRSMASNLGLFFRPNLQLNMMNYDVFAAILAQKNLLNIPKPS